MGAWYITDLSVHIFSYATRQWRHGTRLKPSNEGHVVLVAGIGDVDGDGLSDIAAGVPGSPDPGDVFVLSSKNCVELFSAAAPPHPQNGRPKWNGFPFEFKVKWFPWGLMELHDVDGDGTPDTWAAGLDTVFAILSGRSGELLLEAPLADVRGSGASVKMGEGATAALADDCDGDGVQDVVVGSSESVTCDGATLSLLSSATLELLRRVEAADLLAELACSCDSGGQGADVASALQRHETVLVVAGTTCGTVATFRATSDGFSSIWWTELSAP